LQLTYLPMLKMIRFLAENGFTLMMVLLDFLFKPIAALQLRAHQAWMYTREDATRLERGHGSDLDPSTFTRMLSKLSVDLSSASFITPPPMWCMLLCLGQAMRSQLLKQFPALDDIDITPW
jgi:hypothetical protein